MKNTDGFSWHRVSMVANYYMPRIRWQVMFYPLISLVAFALGMLTYNPATPETGFWFVGVLQYFVMFGPLALAFHRNRDKCEPASAPAARGSEKATFLVIYSLVVLPVLALAPCDIAMNIAYGRSLFVAGPVADAQVAALLPSAAVQRAENILGLLFATSVCACVVVYARRKVTLKSIGFIILGNVGLALVTVIIMMFMPSMKALVNSTPKLHTASGVTDALAPVMNRFYTLLIPITAVAIVLVIVLIYRGAVRRSREEAEENAGTEV